MPRHFRPIGALATVVVGTLVLALAIGAPAHADEYPSWDEVENARQDEAATAAAVDQIQTLLVGLESDAAELGREAQLKAEAYNVAKGELDAASAKADSLGRQADDAEERAGISLALAGQLVARFARTGGGSVTLDLLLSPDSEDLLDSLATMGKLTEQATLIYRQATLDQNLASSLTEQAKVAQAERTSLADEAQSAFDDAQVASSAALALVQQQQASADQLYDQLAALKGTTADVERRYIEGVSQPAPPTPAPAPVDPGPGAPAPSDPAPGIPGPSEPGPADPPPAAPAPSNPAPSNPAPPSPSAVDGAIAFARAQLGDRYGFAGYGPDVWDCSGLTKAAYASVGVYIGIHGASSQYTYLSGQGRLVPVNQIVPGDLLFYSEGGTTWGTKYHTAIYIGNGQMIEAQMPGVPVKVASMRYYDLVPYAARPTG